MKDAKEFKVGNLVKYPVYDGRGNATGAMFHGEILGIDDGMVIVTCMGVKTSLVAIDTLEHE